MEARLRQALQRAEEVERLLADPAVAKDPAQLQSLGREHARLAPVVRLADRLARLESELEQARELAGEADPELAALARADLARIPPEIGPLSVPGIAPRNGGGIVVPGRPQPSSTSDDSLNSGG